MGREHLRNIALLPDTRVSAILEPDPGMRSRAAVLAPDAEPVNSVHELVNSGIDALVLATPNYQHAEQLLEILAIRPLPTLVEKPLVTKLDEVQRLLELGPHVHQQIWVGMEYRYMPPVAELLRQLRSGMAGDLHMMSIREHRYPFLRKVGNWNRFNRYTGGTLVEKCCHFFDLMRLFAAGEARRVYASMGQNVNHLDEHYEEGIPDIVDNALVLVDFTAGQRASLDLCMFAEGARFEQEISLTGSEARLDCRIPAPWQISGDKSVQPELTYNPRRPGKPVTRTLTLDETLLDAGSHQGATYYEHRAFRRFVLGEQAAEVTLLDGLKAVVLGMAAQHAARLGQVTEISPDGLGFSCPC